MKINLEWQKTDQCLLLKSRRTGGSISKEHGETFLGNQDGWFWPESLGDDPWSLSPFLPKPNSLSRTPLPLVSIFPQQMHGLMQNPRGLHCHSPKGTCQRLPGDLCVPQITLWDLSGHMVQRTGLFISQHVPAAEPSPFWIPLKIDSLSCQLVCE